MLIHAHAPKEPLATPPWRVLSGKSGVIKAHDEGRSVVYDAKKCNAVSAQFFRNPNWNSASRAICLARLLATGIDHSRPRPLALEYPIPQSQ